MTEISIGGDTKKLELNCNKKLSGFVSKLNQYAINLKKHSTELKQIAGDLVMKSQQLQKLENIKPENLRCYSMDQRDRVLAEILYQMNQKVITANQLIKEVEEFHTELKVDFQNLSASACSLQIITTEGSIIAGDHKQKPISYYLEEACQILYTWKLYQQSLNLSLSQIEVRNDESIRQFETVTQLNASLSMNLDRYLLFSTFLLAQK
ncbi:uncharacterized protein LOC116342106 [Contarinia nasturtii]|uniref:uncharacterized protein LOC116342106 n=1 Tax=Contarinia nasturtii TaxID=265458 RepID=UPI0012D42DDF|nr:uncharacterized protein LOC116342106 [Contarinia nasturtii]